MSSVGEPDRVVAGPVDQADTEAPGILYSVTLFGANGENVPIALLLNPLANHNLPSGPVVMPKGSGFGLVDDRVDGDVAGIALLPSGPRVG